jgi:hypothetical protein
VSSGNTASQALGRRQVNAAPAGRVELRQHFDGDLSFRPGAQQRVDGRQQLSNRTSTKLPRPETTTPGSEERVLFFKPVAMHLPLPELRFQILRFFHLLMHQKTMQQPAKDNANCENEKHQQGAGHGERPEQESYFNNSDILDNEEHGKTGKNEAQYKFKIHFFSLPSCENIPGPSPQSGDPSSRRRLRSTALAWGPRSLPGVPQQSPPYPRQRRQAAGSSPVRAGVTKFCHVQAQRQP